MSLLATFKIANFIDGVPFEGVGIDLLSWGKKSENLMVFIFFPKKTKKKLEVKTNIPKNVQVVGNQGPP